jgi:hypothetical protein
MKRLANLMPRRGCIWFASTTCSLPAPSLRAAIVPRPPENTIHNVVDHAYVHSAPAHMSWARLLKRIFEIDIELCSHRGGSLKIVATIKDPPVNVRILAHLGLPARAPSRALAQRVDLFQPA